MSCSIKGNAVYQLNLSENKNFKELIDKSVNESPYSNLEEFIISSRLIFDNFPTELKKSIFQFKRFSNKYGAFLIRNLPQDSNLPNTYKGKDKETFYSESMLSMIASVLGEQISYAQEKKGLIFQNIHPVFKNETMWSNESSRIFLPFHTEAAFHPYLPSYILLYCIRPDIERNAETLVSNIFNISKKLNEEEISLLRKNIFETGIDYSFGAQNKIKGGGITKSIIYGNKEDPLFCFDPGLMHTENKLARKLIKKVEMLSNQLAVSVKMKAGDLLVIDNQRSVHARTSFRPTYDIDDRWIQRLYVVGDLVSSTKDRKDNSRIINSKILAI